MGSIGLDVSLPEDGNTASFRNFVFFFFLILEDGRSPKTGDCITEFCYIPEEWKPHILCFSVFITFCIFRNIYFYLPVLFVVPEMFVTYKILL